MTNSSDGGDQSDWKSRRSFMGGLGATMGVAYGGFGLRSGSTDGWREVNEALVSSTPPKYPEDPFMQAAFGMQILREEPRKGYEKITRAQKLRTLLHLHPDVLAYDHLSTYMDGEVRTSDRQLARLEIAHQLGRPATSGWNVNIKAGDDAQKRYGPLMEENDWRFPDGTPLESPTEILAETFEGEPQQISFTFNTLGIPSIFGSGGLDLLIETTNVRLEQGYSGFLVDGVGVFRFQGLDFSRWAQAAFRSHLQSLSDEKLTKLGISDPSSFDIRDYLRENRLTPEDEESPMEDPVFREYLLHHHEGIDKWFENYRLAVEERFPERMAAGEIALYANQFTGHFGNPQAANVYVSDSLDLIYTELFPRVEPAVDVNYKTMRSVGNFSKPVVGKGTLTSTPEKQLGGIEPETPNPNLLRFQVAEAYASGARFQLPITARAAFSEADSVTNWVEPDGTIPEDLRSFADFLWAHERFLTGLEPDGEVALIWSLPTRIWRHEPSWNIGQQDCPRLDSFLGTAKLLREAGIAYDVLTFGHPRLWDDTEQLDRLTDFDAIVLPAIESIADEQVAELKSYLDAGGSVINSGPMPDRNGFYEPRHDVTPLFDHENATVLQSDPGRKRESEGIHDPSLVAAIKEGGVQPRRIGDDQSIAVHVHAQSDPSRKILQLINYDYDATTDSFASKSGVRVRLPELRTADPAVRYYSPQQRQELEITNDGEQAIVEIPKLVEWGILAIAESAESLVRGDPETARSRIDEAEQKIEAASEAGRENEDEFFIAQTQLSAAKTAHDFNAYQMAREAAEEALHAVTPLVPTSTSTTRQKRDESTPTQTQSENTATTTVEATTRPDSTTENSTTSTETPGLGILAAISGIGLAALEVLREADRD